MMQIQRRDFIKMGTIAIQTIALPFSSSTILNITWHPKINLM